MSSLIGYLLSGYVFRFMETALEKHIMQIFKSPYKKTVRDHGAKVRFSGTTAAEAIPQPFFHSKKDFGMKPKVIHTKEKAKTHAHAMET